jgi:hypothetical protein
VILLISASWIARITGMRHQHLRYWGLYTSVALAETEFSCQGTWYTCSSWS